MSATELGQDAEENEKPERLDYCGFSIEASCSANREAPRNTLTLMAWPHGLKKGPTQTLTFEISRRSLAVLGKRFTEYASIGAEAEESEAATTHNG